MRFAGASPNGKRVYITRSRPVCFAVYARKPWEARWKLVTTVEDKMHSNELHRINGSYRPVGRDVTAAEKAEIHAEWWQSVGGSLTKIITLTPVRARASTGVAS